MSSRAAQTARDLASALSGPVDFKISLDVSAESEQIVTDYCISHLRERGYSVAAPWAEWERNGAFCKRVGIYPHRLQEVIESYGRRGGPPIRVDRRGDSLRLVALQSNPSFDGFCRSMTRPRKSKS